MSAKDFPPGLRFGHVVRFSAALSCGLSLMACAGAERFLPPGFVKYEDLEQGRPVNPDIEAVIETNDADGPLRYPRLADQPSRRPTVAPVVERTEYEQELKTRSAALRAAANADKAAAVAEREESFESQITTLEEAIARDNAAAARERRGSLAPPPPPLKNN